MGSFQNLLGIDPGSPIGTIGLTGGDIIANDVRDGIRTVVIDVDYVFLGVIDVDIAASSSADRSRMQLRCCGSRPDLG
jgi:hypothetical protein